MIHQTLFPFPVFHNEEINSEKCPSLPYKSGKESIMMGVVGFKK